MSGLAAALLLGGIWALWHLPELVSEPSGQRPPIQFVVLVVAQSVFFTWLYNSTDGSLLLIILLHTSFDVCTTGPWAGALMAAHGGVYGVDPLLILMVLEVVLALSVVLLTNPRTLTRRRSGT
jgi:membrane protease YdiL (CAAX protease family)